MMVSALPSAETHGIFIIRNPDENVEIVLHEYYFYVFVRISGDKYCVSFNQFKWIGIKTHFV